MGQEQGMGVFHHPLILTDDRQVAVDWRALAKCDLKTSGRVCVCVLDVPHFISKCVAMQSEALPQRLEVPLR